METLMPLMLVASMFGVGMSGDGGLVFSGGMYSAPGFGSSDCFTDYNIYKTDIQSEKVTCYVLAEHCRVLNISCIPWGK